jgi:hypothetical protein
MLIGDTKRFRLLCIDFIDAAGLFGVYSEVSLKKRSKVIRITDEE